MSSTIESEFLFRWELTDTFGGEANYCWARRGIIRTTHRPKDGERFSWDEWRKRVKRVCRAARREAGISGARSKRSDFGDMIRYDQGCTVLFVELGEHIPQPDDPTPAEA